MAKLTDTELVALCDAAIAGAIGQGSELSDDRAKALDRYLGEPLGNEIPDRSQVRTREVLDVVEQALPNLIRLFALEDNAVEFAPTGPEDEEAARQETELVRHVFWNTCDGYSILYDFAKDGLLSKNGIAKVWWEDDEKASRETYRGLIPQEYAALRAQEDVEVDVLEETANDDGTVDVVCIVTRPRGRPHIAVVPPEEFGIARGQTSLDCGVSTFVFHRVKKTLADLVAAGYSRQKVQTLSADDPTNPEHTSRYHLDDEGDSTSAVHWSMRETWVTECYPLVDRDDDGIAERLKVTLVGGSGSYTLMGVEEVDDQPFVAWSPIPLSHKFVGLSLADLSVDVQETKTALLRGILDNMYLANNARTACNERVNQDDLLVSRPGALVRTEGYEPPQNHLYQFQTLPVPQQTFELMEYLDRAVRSRTGVGEDVAGLDTAALSNVNTGVAALAFDSARMRIELIARNLAEYGLRPLFSKIHELLRKHSERPMVVRLRNRWVQVAPQEWRERENLTVKIGVGNASREQRSLALANVIQLQQQMLSVGAGALVNPGNLYTAISDLMEISGLTGASAKYFSDPRQAPPAPPAPDPNMLKLQQDGQIAAAKVQLDQGRLQLDTQRAQADAQAKQVELQLREREVALKAQVEQMRAQMAIQARAINEQSEVANARAELLTKELQARQQEWNGQIQAMQLRLDAVKSERDRDEKRYEAELKAATEVAKIQAAQQQQALAAISSQVQALSVERSRDDGLSSVLTALEGLEEKVEGLRAPKKRARKLLEADDDDAAG